MQHFGQTDMFSVVWESSRHKVFGFCMEVLMLIPLTLPYDMIALVAGIVGLMKWAIHDYFEINDNKIIKLLSQINLFTFIEIL